MGCNVDVAADGRTKARPALAGRALEAPFVAWPGASPSASLLPGFPQLGGFEL
jgi:hypothetical protein